MKEGEGYHAKKIESIFDEFETSKKGLNESEAKKRLEKYGKNKIDRKKKFQWLKTLLNQFNSFLIYILIIASAVMFYLGNLLDAIVIFIIVLLNGGIGFFQQYKAEKAIENLKKLVVQKTRVIREGKKIEISSEEVVPGDIVYLEQGDKINADCRIIDEKNAQANEAVLTGESFPVSKTSKILGEKIDLAKRENMLYTGTQLVRGEATAVVVSTGMSSVFGNIAGTLEGIKVQKTPMQKRLDKFSKQLGLGILGLLVIVTVVGMLYEFDMVEMFLTSVALAISAIPEGLPAVLAIAFSISSVMMSKKKVVIRRLPAVESLGSVTTICTDKTGTLTEEKMNVEEIYANGNLFKKKDKKILLNNKKINLKNKKEISKLIRTSILCNDVSYEKEGKEYKLLGDPTEQALVRCALDLNINKKQLEEENPEIEKFRFDSERKMMSVLRDNGRNNTLYSKGALEKILEVSKFEYTGSEIKKLSEKRKKEILKSSKEMEKKALRVLGFAYKNFNKKEKAEEKGMIFLGFSGMIDPPRKEVKGAIKKCKDAGIEVKIITGDSLITASAIAKKIGVEGNAISSQDLNEMDDEELSKKIDNLSIFARVTPQQKLRITKILQEKNETVAITGDGVNDVLALKSADIGIAMGVRGTDVARDVADIVLTNDNFASIVEGVNQGRKTYDNIKKFTKYLLAVNFSGILLITATIFMKMPLPLLPLQILWINLITDSFPALTLVFEKPENVMKSKPRREKSLFKGIWKFLIVAGSLKFLVLLLVYLINMGNNVPIEKVRTMVLMTVIFFELTFVYVCRSNKSLMKIGMFSNKWLNLAVIFGLVLQFILMYTPLSKAFDVVNLSLSEWAFVLPFAVSGFVIFEAGKLILEKRNNPNKN